LLAKQQADRISLLQNQFGDLQNIVQGKYQSPGSFDSEDGGKSAATTPKRHKDNEGQAQNAAAQASGNASVAGNSAATRVTRGSTKREESRKTRLLKKFNNGKQG